MYQYSPTHPKVLHGNSKRVQHVYINSVVLQIDKLHLLSDLLESSLGCEGSEISSHVTVRLLGNCFKVNIVI